mmetsp:Transcript_63297/g.110496  ORF Transcript_63297/g.110496 Transcript_63297/m.110496 type:complete len:201 (+) Transcript_63297:2048-2650(+)
MLSPFLPQRLSKLCPCYGCSFPSWSTACLSHCRWDFAFWRQQQRQGRQREPPWQHPASLPLSLTLSTACPNHCHSDSSASRLSISFQQPCQSSCALHCSHCCCPSFFLFSSYHNFCSCFYSDCSSCSSCFCFCSHCAFCRHFCCHFYFCYYSCSCCRSSSSFSGFACTMALNETWISEEGFGFSQLPLWLALSAHLGHTA